MDNVNKANVMLTLQKETEKFLLDREKSESLTFSEGKAVINPSALGDSVNASLDNHYRIGFKKAVNTDGTETISAIIVEKKGSGSDVKTAKIANMIGISAGIKSAMNDHHAYGIKGLWKEQLSDYGITNVPAGSAVVTTKYNKNKNSFYSSDMIIDSNIDMDGRATPCVFATGYAANNAKEVIRQCSRSTAANHAACARAYIDDLNGNCEKIKLAGENFTNFYKFTVVASKDTTNYSHYNVTNVDGLVILWVIIWQAVHIP